MRLNFLQDYLPPVGAWGLVGYLCVLRLIQNAPAQAEFLILLMAGLFAFTMGLWMSEDRLTPRVTAHLLTFGNTLGAIVLIEYASHAGAFESLPVSPRLFQLAFVLNAAYCHYWYRKTAKTEPGLNRSAIFTGSKSR